MGECHGSHAVFDVDADGYPQPDVIDTGIRGDKVYEDFTVADTDILGMEISFIAGVGIDCHARLYIRLQFQPFVKNQGAARLDKCCIMAEAFQIGFFGAVYIQMIGVSGCDDAYPGRQPVERTVKFVCLDYGVGTFLREQQVCTVVLCNASEKSGASHMGLMQEVGGHGTGSCLAVCAGHAESFAVVGDDAQYL